MLAFGDELREVLGRGLAFDGLVGPELAAVLEREAAFLVQDAEPAGRDEEHGEDHEGAGEVAEHLGHAEAAHAEQGQGEQAEHDGPEGPVPLVGLGAGFGYALYTIFGHYAIERGYDSLTITFYTFLVAAVTSLFMVRLPHVAGAMSGSAVALGYVLCLGIISTILPFLLYTLGLHFLQGGRASVIASIEPVTAALVGIFCYHEALTVQTAAGIALVLAGIAAGAEKDEKRSAPAEA